MKPPMVPSVKVAALSPFTWSLLRKPCPVSSAASLAVRVAEVAAAPRLVATATVLRTVAVMAASAIASPAATAAYTGMAAPALATAVAMNTSAAKRSVTICGSAHWPVGSVSTMGLVSKAW